MAEKSNKKTNDSEGEKVVKEKITKKPVEKKDTEKIVEKVTKKTIQKDIKNEDFVVVDINGSQEKVSKGSVVVVNKIDGEPDSKITFDRVLLSYKSNKTEIGAPTIKDAKVEAKILEQEKGPKMHIRTYKAKSRYRRHKGHRQLITKLEITKI